MENEIAKTMAKFVTTGGEAIADLLLSDPTCIKTEEFRTLLNTLNNFYLAMRNDPSFCSHETFTAFQDMRSSAQHVLQEFREL